MDTQQTFLAEVEKHMAITGQSATEFGREALNDPNFIHELRNGRSCSLKTVEKIRDFMRGHCSAAETTSTSKAGNRDAA